MLLCKQIDRRNFIKGSLAVFGALAFADTTSALTPDTRSSIRWAFLSDTHVPEDAADNYRGFFPYRNMEQVVPQVLAASPHAVAITGDLARLTGQIGDYENLKKLLAPLTQKAPVFVSLGNHDHRENFIAVFENLPRKQQPVPQKYVVIADVSPVRVIMLDSLFYTNKAPGLLGKAQRTWLAEYLANDDNTPTILCFHHTISDGDNDLLDMPRLYDIIAPARKVKAIVYGHSHVYSFSQYEGIHQINLPATGYNFSDEDPVGWVEAELTSEGGDFTLHAIAGNTAEDAAVTKLTWRT